MSEDEIKLILEDIEKQGFPLEVKTSEVLKVFGWQVVNQFAYLDYEEQKFRTVDMFALKALMADKEMGINLDLIMECKKTAKPWVFYTSNYNQKLLGMRRMTVAGCQYFISQIAYQKKSAERLDDLIMHFLFHTHMGSPIFGKVAYIPFESFTGGKGRNIHKARMQVCNAILHLKQRSQENQIDFPYGDIHIPVIVLDGHLYAYEDGKLNAEEGFYYNVTYANSSFIIEIVTKDFLETYLDLIEQEIKKFQTKFAKQK